jgi:hypothetical protein
MTVRHEVKFASHDYAAAMLRSVIADRAGWEKDAETVLSSARTMKHGAQAETSQAVTHQFEIKKVARYLLIRSIITDRGPDMIEMAEFKRRDDAERVMGTMRAAIYPITPASEEVAQ